MSQVLSYLCDIELKNGTFDWRRSNAPKTSISSRESNLLNYAKLLDYGDSMKRLVNDLVYKDNNDIIVRIPFARLDHRNTLKVENGKFVGTKFNATMEEKNKLASIRDSPKENTDLGLTSYKNDFCNRHVQNLIKLDALLNSPSKNFHDDFIHILSYKEKDVFRVVDYVAFALYKLTEVIPKVTKSGRLSSYGNIDPIFIQELIACCKTLIEKIQELLGEANANNTILLEELKASFKDEFDISPHVFDKAVKDYSRNADHSIADVSINEFARVEFAGVLCAALAKDDDDYNEKFVNIYGKDDYENPLATFYDSDPNIAKVDSGTIANAILAKCIIFNLRKTKLTYNTIALDRSTMYYTFHGIDGAVLKNDYDMIENFVSLNSEGVDKLSATNISATKKSQEEKNKLKRTVLTNKEIHARLEFRKSLNYCLDKLNDAYSVATTHLKYDGMLHFSANTSILSVNRITSALLPPKDIAPRPFQRRYLEELFVRMKSRYEEYAQVNLTAYEFKYEEMMGRLKLINHENYYAFGALVKHISGDSVLRSNFKKYIERKYTCLLIVAANDSDLFIKLIAQFVYNMRPPNEDELINHRYKYKNLKNIIPESMFDSLKMAEIFNLIEDYIKPTATVALTSNKLPPIEIYYIASVANSGKTTLAIMAAKLVELFKKTYTNSPNFEIVFSCANGLVRNSVRVEALRCKINVAMINDKAEVHSAMAGEYQNQGLKSKNRSLAIMSPLMLIPYRTNNISKEHSVALGNFDSFVIIDEYCANIGSPDAASVLEDAKSFGDISKALRQYAIETLFTNRANSLFTVMGATMVPSDNIRSAVTSSKKTLDEDCKVISELDGEIHVGVDCQLYDGRTFNMWSMGPRSHIRFYFSSFLHPLYKRLMTHNTSNFLKREINNCLNLKKTYNTIKKALDDVGLDIKADDVREDLTDLIHENLREDDPMIADLYEVWGLMAEYNLKTIRSYKDYDRLKSLKPYLESNLDKYTGNSIANYACGLASFVVQCGSNYIESTDEKLTNGEMKEYWLKVSSASNETTDLPIPEEAPYPQMLIPAATDLNHCASTVPLGDEYYSKFEMYEKYFPMNRRKIDFSASLHNEYLDRMKSKSSRTIVFSGRPEDITYLLLGKILKYKSDDLSEIKKKVDEYITAEVREFEDSKKHAVESEIKEIEVQREDVRTGHKSTKVTTIQNDVPTRKRSGRVGEKYRIKSLQDFSPARPTNLHRFAYMFGISLITEEEIGDINLSASLINIGDRRLAYSVNMNRVTKIIFDPITKICFSPFDFIQGQARAGRVGLSDSCTSISDDETAFRMFVSSKSAQLNNFFLTLEKICSSHRNFNRIFDNYSEINYRTNKHVDPVLTKSVVIPTTKAPQYILPVFTEAIYYDDLKLVESIVRSYPSIVNEPFVYNQKNADIIHHFAQGKKEKKEALALSDSYANYLEFALAVNSENSLDYLKAMKSYVDKLQVVELVTWAIKQTSVEIGMVSHELIEYFVGSAANGFDDPIGVAKSVLKMEQFDAVNLIKLLAFLSHRYSLANDVHNYTTYTDVLNTRIDERSGIIADVITPDITMPISIALGDRKSKQPKMTVKQLEEHRIDKKQERAELTGETMSAKNKVYKKTNQSKLMAEGQISRWRSTAKK